MGVLLSKSPVITFVDRQSTAVIPVLNRGLCYGDGLFETLRFVEDELVLWPLHVARIKRGLTTLGFGDHVDFDGVRQFIECQVRSRLGAAADAMVRLTLLRTEGVGYRPGDPARVTEIVSFQPYQMPPLTHYQQGISLRCLEWPLSRDPRLGGLKHLNRLSQVMASRELRSDEFEGVVLDCEGYVIEATRSNLLVFRNGEWSTPDLRDAGIRGVMRDYLLQGTLAGDEPFPPLAISPLKVQQLGEVSAMALINSVFGVIPVASLNGRNLDVLSVIERWQRPVHNALKLPRETVFC